MRYLLLITLLTGCAAPLHYQAVRVADDLVFNTEHHLLPPVDILIPTIPGDSKEAYFQKLVNISPLPVMLSLPPKQFESLWGLTDGDFIWINSKLSPNGRVATLAHELGHVMQPSGLTAKEGDIFAETVSLLFCQSIGLDVSLSSFTYLNIVSRDSHQFIIKHHKDIDDAARQLIKGTGG